MHVKTTLCISNIESSSLFVDIEDRQYGRHSSEDADPTAGMSSVATP